ncbi:MAG TPA: Asp-tRNA(Asn)/Glu-tRNA(Gln) amidotransferase subunit GatC [Thiotrichaceae bacterium]|jgi:aspartyl-tRNA(Asn)/glutamyl-tRNA(Gln) amidotransferase subunit C|nr:Asp-tRNA(Asn)/Glu-tRNA(Gln) amidotransferase subunit GatC [Thiotrichaceae bacterium]HIM07925.1 Asp-tRNA(Asn)/Glu-tRNA(Gln) amidotransferase subunit GatC [Gammaproteobacteria bacterium]
MSLDKSEVEKIAWLARLAIDEQDIPDYSDELSNILELVERMNSVNTDGISPIAHPLELSARLRTDEVTETNQRDHFQKDAPLIDEGCYLVPKVIE